MALPRRRAPGCVSRPVQVADPWHGAGTEAAGLQELLQVLAAIGTGNEVTSWPDKERPMIIALLAVLGVDLIVIVVLLAGVLGRRRWVRRQPDAFKGAIRVTSGSIPGAPGALAPRLRPLGPRHPGVDAGALPAAQHPGPRR